MNQDVRINKYYQILDFALEERQINILKWV